MRSTIICLLLALSMTFCGAFALADTGTEVCFEDAMLNANPDGTPRILYTGRTKISLNMRSAADKESESLGVLPSNAKVQIFGFDQVWLFCWSEEVGIYFLGRHNVDFIEPVSEGIMP